MLNPPMFIYRLKQEFRENRLMSIMWLLSLVMVYVGYKMWWKIDVAEVHDNGQALMGIGILSGTLVVLIMSYTACKRDDLKDPTAFWATRPVRAFAMFGAKMVYLQLVLTLPLVVAVVGLISLNGDAGYLLWNGLEVMLWGVLATGLLSLSAMVRGGVTMAFWLLGLLGGSLALACAFISYCVPGGERRLSDAMQVANNMLVALIVVAGLVVLAVVWQIRDKHRLLPWWIPSLTGVCVAVFLSYGNMPHLSDVKSDDLVDGQEIVSKAALEPQQVVSLNRNGIPGYEIGYFIDVSQISHDMGDFSVSGGKLEIVGESSQYLSVEFFGGITQSMVYDGKQRPSRTSFSIAIMRDPIDNRYGSMSSQGVEEGIFENVPRKVVRVRGYLEVQTTGTQEVYRGPKDKKFEVKGRGWHWVYDPSAQNLHDPNRGALVGRQFQLALLTSPRSYHHNGAQLKLTDGVLSFTTHENSNSSNSSPLGRGWEKGVNLETVNSHEWQNGGRDGEFRDIEAWIRKADIALDRVVWVKKHRIPVDVEVSIPDPERVREMLAE